MPGKINKKGFRDVSMSKSDEIKGDYKRGHGPLPCTPVAFLAITPRTSLSTKLCLQFFVEQ